MKLTARPIFLSLLLLAAMPAAAEGPVFLTVTGDVTAPNRGPVDPDYDKLFIFNEVKFDKAHEFDLADLEKLPQQSVKADFPKGGAETEFSGPLLSDVLAAAGATGETVTVQAMDGYAVEVPLSELVSKGAVVAIARDGRPFGIGNFGPTQIVFPRSERADLKDMPDDWWIWQIYRIDVK
ncbi:MAG: molybdopterin-dependent oxidoreductase [Amaricoccus sp.]|uniref:molybdopterin-dependent oxidoreductase n=1 Tax=Amaricoccus sp. TaxID=1872485 RepID=UPI0039E5E278